MQGPDAHGTADSSPSEDGHGPGRHAIAELTAPAGAAASGDAKNGVGADGDGRAASELVLAALHRVEARAAGRDLSGQPTGRHRA
jgi:hypothetical protein